MHIKNCGMWLPILYRYRGTIGSCLHKTEDGLWLAYSRWPDKATRDASWSSDNTIDDLPDLIKETITS